MDPMCSFTICKQLEDLHCSTVHYDFSVSDHLYYYDIEVVIFERDNYSDLFISDIIALQQS